MKTLLLLISLFALQQTMAQKIFSVDHESQADVKVFVAGPGDPTEVEKCIDPQLRHRFEFLGKITEQDKVNFMSSVAIYVAPNTGGESFGIILAEALAGGATKHPHQQLPLSE